MIIMNIIQFIQFMVMAPPDYSAVPIWLWIVMGVLFVFSMILLANSQTPILSKFSKKNVD